MNDINDNSIKHAVHDLNSIFTKILNSIELIKKKSDKSNDDLLLLNSIETNIYLASEILEDLIPTKKPINSFHLVNINSLIKEVVKSFPINKKKEIKIDLNLSTGLKQINGKYSDFFRMIMNLITNSYEAIEKKGTILIKTMNDKDGIYITVKDDGIGIDEKDLEFIFDDKFSTKEKNTISGVGLSIVKKIVDKYDGNILVESKLNQGTTFKIFLKSINDIVNTKPSNKKILIAEDENILRELMTELFISYNFEVVAVQDGKELIDTVDNSFDAIIVDKNIPIIDGIDCIKSIRERGIYTPIILASGSQIDDTDENISLVQKIILKPFNFEEMLKSVNELINWAII